MLAQSRATKLGLVARESRTGRYEQGRNRQLAWYVYLPVTLPPLLWADQAGYVAIYCVGLSTGEHIMRATAPARQTAVAIKSLEEHIQRHIDKRRTELALELFSYAFGWWVAVLAVRLTGFEVSRRLVSPFEYPRGLRLKSGQSPLCPLGGRLQYYFPLWILGPGDLPLFVRRNTGPSTTRGHRQQWTSSLFGRQRPYRTDQPVHAYNVR